MKRLIQIFIIQIVVIFSLVGQSSNIRLGDKNFEKYDYSQAISYYQKELKRDSSNIVLLKKVGDGYYALGDYSKALDYYGQYVEKGPSESDSIFKMRYTQLKSSQKAQREIEDTDYHIHSLYSNTKYSEYATSKLGDELYLITNKPIEKLNKRYDRWTGLNFNSLVSYNLKNGLKNAVLTKEIEGIQIGSYCVSKDGSQMYITVNLNKVKLEKGARESSLKILRYTNKEGKWVNPEILGFNSDAYNCAHPVIDNQGEYMYFTSDMPGGKGQSDLYKISLSGDMKRAINLGSSINTAARESFPYIDEQGKLYFSSDRVGGLGGLDIWQVDLEGKEGLKNLGSPINSPSDDFGIIKVSSQNGYFTSNRAGESLDDVYSFSYSRKKEILAVYELNINELKQQSIGLQASSKEISTKIKAINLARAGSPVTAENKESIAEKLKSFIIYFDFDRSILTQTSKDILDELIDLMAEYKDLKVELYAHTDQRGNAEYNKRLSNRRAEAALNYILQNGHFSKERIGTFLLGKAEPAVDCPNCNIKQNLVNRRVEFRIK